LAEIKNIDQWLAVHRVWWYEAYEPVKVAGRLHEWKVMFKTLLASEKAMSPIAGGQYPVGWVHQSFYQERED
jgi:hypothetical protein